MEHRREHETQAHLLDTLLNAFRRQINFDPQGFQHIGAAAGAGGGPVAVFGHLQSSACRHEGRGGGDVEAVLAVSTGAAGVNQGAGNRHL